jgi:transposase-like protein
MDQIKREQRSVPSEPKRGRRRRYTTAQKLAIVRECLVPGASLAGVAMAHQANANMVRKWVVKLQGGGFGEAAESGVTLLPVAVREARAPLKLAVAAATVTLEIEMRGGVVRFYAAPNSELLKPFITALIGR